MSCPKCGAENSDDGVACPACGEESFLARAPTASGAKGRYDHLFLAIAARLIEFTPLGLVAIFYAARVNRKLLMGGYDGAAISSKRARVLSYVAIALMPFVIVIAQFLRRSGSSEI